MNGLAAAAQNNQQNGANLLHDILPSSQPNSL